MDYVDRHHQRAPGQREAQPEQSDRAIWHVITSQLRKFVGRARDPYRSTVCVSTVTRGTFDFYSVYK